MAASCKELKRMTLIGQAFRGFKFSSVRGHGPRK
jgi:hypothetical protein